MFGKKETSPEPFTLFHNLLNTFNSVHRTQGTYLQGLDRYQQAKFLKYNWLSKQSTSFPIVYSYLKKKKRPWLAQIFY